MRLSTCVPVALAAYPSFAAALGVTGTAVGFASGTTGGAGGATVTPSTIQELTNYLTSKDPLTIVLTKTFDYTGSEGTTTETGCAPWGTGSGCQLAINANNWCGSNPSVQVTYDKAGTVPIDVQSKKSIVGSGSNGVIKGKGLRFANGVSNIILQNVHITNLNPKYVWGGDAITLDGSDNIWIDHVKISLIGRQHIVTGYGSNKKVTISNSEIDGQTSWSATCDGHHYWNLFFTGSNDQITLKSNYIHTTSGRAPKVGGLSLIHVVNNYWSDNTGHAFEGESSYALVEGNTFDNVVAAEEDKFTGSIYVVGSGDSQCKSALGRDCVANTFKSSGQLSGTATSVFDQMQGLTIAKADLDASRVPSTAGVGKI